MALRPERQPETQDSDEDTAPPMEERKSRGFLRRRPRVETAPPEEVPQEAPEGEGGSRLSRVTEPVSRSLRQVGRRTRPLVVFLTKSHARVFLLATGSLAATSLILVSLDLLAPSLFVALLGFGLAIAALLHIAFPSLAQRLDALPRHRALAVWALLTVGLSLVGFSSSAVIVLVLLIGGFTAGNVYWRFLSRLMDKREVVEMGMEERTRRSRRLLLSFALLGLGSLTAIFALGYYHISDIVPMGRGLLFGSAGLMLGLLPTINRLIRSARDPQAAAEHLFHLRHLFRDVLFVGTVVGLVGYEVSIATDGGLAFGIPALVVVIVLLSYLGILIRGFLTIRERLKPYDPLPQAAFGMLLLFSPIVVVLSNPSATVGRLYGAAQAFGLMAGLIYVGMKEPWKEESRRLFDRFQAVVQRRVLPESEETRAKAEAEKRAKQKRRRFFRRRVREEETGS